MILASFSGQSLYLRSNAIERSPRWRRVPSQRRGCSASETIGLMPSASRAASNPSSSSPGWRGTANDRRVGGDWIFDSESKTKCANAIGSTYELRYAPSISLKSTNFLRCRVSCL